ncbi:hypothetical protein ABIA30_002825 [Mycobacterium sp. MAA66]|uniref:DUF4097 family beta strand repeat-containing protein n=1 Tax=Mycobacterium sp. MAA66 TaxID=3156297 RepID=UPI0035129E88
MTSEFVTNPTDAPAPRSLTPSGRSAIRTLLVIAAVAVTVSAVVGVGGIAWGIASLRVAADTQTLPANMEALTIDTGQVPTAIRIISDRNLREPKVRMRLLNTSRTDAGALTVARDGNAIGLTIAGTPSQLLNFGPPGEITVTLPPDVAHRLSVTTKQRTGLLFSQSELSQLTVRNTDGAVVLDGDARRIEIHTQSGEIRTRDAISVTDAFTADTNDGHISVDFRDAAPRTVQVTGRDADIEIALPPAGPYLVRAQAGNDLKVRVPQTDDAARAAAQVTARAEDGSVTITTRR